MTACKAGDVVVVPFPFTDLRTTKKRPALVLAVVPSKQHPLLAIVAMVTSQVEGERIPGDCLLTAWKEAGLLHPSKVRLAKIVSLEESMLLKNLGSLQKSDRSKIGCEFGKLFSDWSSKKVSIDNM